MHKNIDDAINGINQIENGLPRRLPTIKRWQGKGYMANTKKWYYLYKTDGTTVYVTDACHAQNMHESISGKISKLLRECLTANTPLTEGRKRVVTMDESSLYIMIRNIAKKVICEEYKVTKSPEYFEDEHGNKLNPVATLKDEHGGVSHIVKDDGCYVLFNGSSVRKVPFVKSYWIYPEAHKVLRDLPDLPVY